MRDDKTNLDDFTKKYIYGNESVPQKAYSKLQPGPGSMWYNGCAFGCLACSLMLWGRSFMDGHVVKCAASAATDFGKDKRMARVVRGLYRCKIYDFDVLHDHNNIREHIKNHKAPRVSTNIDENAKWSISHLFANVTVTLLIPFQSGKRDVHFTHSTQTMNNFS
jgi:hypothetical protein